MSQSFVFCIGFTAQLFFSARILTQWILSEKARKVLSPSIFWILSLAGALFTLPIRMAAPRLRYLVGTDYFLLHLHLESTAKRHLEQAVQRVQTIVNLHPGSSTWLRYAGCWYLVNKFFHNEDIPLWLLVMGAIGHYACVKTKRDSHEKRTPNLSANSRSFASNLDFQRFYSVK